VWSGVIVTKLLRFSVFYSFLKTLSHKHNGTRFGVSDSYLKNREEEGTCNRCGMVLFMYIH